MHKIKQIISEINNLLLATPFSLLLIFSIDSWGSRNGKTSLLQNTLIMSWVSGPNAGRCYPDCEGKAEPVIVVLVVLVDGG